MNIRQNLLNKNAVDELAARAEKLTTAHQHLWGRMNVTEMLYHCNRANRFILEDQAAFRKPGLKQRFIRFICFSLLTQIPKNNPQPERIDAKGKTSDDRFFHERDLYIQTIRQFPAWDKPFTSLHPRMGWLNNVQWGRIAWMHMDHHLRQFGV